MKSEKKLKAIFDKAKTGEYIYYSFEDFKQDVKEFLKEIKKGNLVMSMKVSPSGMTRWFNSLKRYNMIMNICYHNKKSFDKIKVGGCGMDMHWYLIYSTCQDLTTKREHNKFNSLASRQPLL